MKKLKFGIPKGSLEKATLNLFEKSGWKINVNDRSYFPDVNEETRDITLCRAQEMSRYVEKGTLDAGLTGKDWVEENQSDVVVVDELIYSKVSQNPARWVLAVPPDSDIKKLQDLNGKKIATELPAPCAVTTGGYDGKRTCTDIKKSRRISPGLQKRRGIHPGTAQGKRKTPVPPCPA